MKSSFKHNYRKWRSITPGTELCRRKQIGRAKYPAVRVPMNIHDLPEFVACLSIIFEVLINDTSRSHKVLQDEITSLKDVLL